MSNPPNNTSLSPHHHQEENERNLYFNWEYLNDPACQRTKPEPWIEKAQPYKRMIAGSEAWGIGIGTAVFSIALVCAVWIMSCNNNKNNNGDGNNGRKGHWHHGHRYLQQENGNGGMIVNGGRYGSLSDEDDQENREVVSAAEEEIPFTPAGTIETEEYYQQKLQQPQPSSPIRIVLSKCCSLTTILLLVPILLGIATFFATIYYPQTPLVNLCSDEVDWVSSLKSLLSDGSIQSSFHTLFSVYNPNRYNAYVLNAIGTVETMEGLKIGYMTMTDLYVPSHAVMDVMTNTTFQLEDQWEALEFMAKYYRGTLTLVFRIEMELGVGSGKGWMKWTKVPLVWTSDCMHITSSGIEYKGRLPYQEGDRHLCKCPT